MAHGPARGPGARGCAWPQASARRSSAAPPARWRRSASAAPRWRVSTPRELDLAEPLAPWHTDRIGLIELGAALAAVAAACAKISGDVVLLAQTEVAEVRESAGRRLLDDAAQAQPRRLDADARLRGQGPTRRMRARRRPSRTSTSGPPGAWQAEWDALTGALAGAGGAAAGVRELLAGLEVDPARMRRNLDLTGGLVMAERIAYTAAARIGLIEAQRLVAEAAARTAAEDVTFRQALVESAGLGLRPEEIDAALDPAAGLESAAALVDRVLDGGESG